MPRWLEVKRIVIYGVVHGKRDHHDYATIGEWTFDLYDRDHPPVVEGTIKTPSGVRTVYRDPSTGRFARAPLFGPHPDQIPDDETIIADTHRVIEDASNGHRLYRTPSQVEAGADRVSIGIQHVGPADVGKTYNYGEYLREIRKRAESEWKNRNE